MRAFRLISLFVVVLVTGLVSTSPASAGMVRGGGVDTFDVVGVYWCSDEELRFTGTATFGYVGADSETTQGPDLVFRSRIEGSAVGLVSGRTYRFLEHSASVSREAADGVTRFVSTANGLLLDNGMAERVHITYAFSVDSDGNLTEHASVLSISCAG